ncbi:MAG: DMT family transporter [Acidimicrobiales bacterium]
MRRILLLAVIWGWSFFFIKVAVGGMTPPTMACLRCALGAVALLALCRAKGWRLPRDRRIWRHFAVMGLIYSALPFSLLGWGEQRTTSALAAVAQADTPLFAALFSVALLGQRIKRIHVVGLAVGFVGVGICAGIASGDLAHSSTAGALAEVASGASYGLAFCYARRYLSGVAPVVAATGQVIAGALIALPFAIATSVQAGIALTPTRAAAIVVLGILATGVAYAVNYASIADVGATKASLVTYLIPIVAVAVGIAVLGEPFQLRVIVGGSVIVIGIALVQDRLGGLRRLLLRLPVVGALLAGVLLGACASSSPDRSTVNAGWAEPHHDPLDPTSVA